MINRDRVLSEAEIIAHEEYESILDKYNNLYNVRCYDRVSVHNAFPEIAEAFEKCRAAGTFYRLTKNYEDEDSD